MVVDMFPDRPPSSDSADLLSSILQFIGHSPDLVNSKTQDTVVKQNPASTPLSYGTKHLATNIP